MSPISEHEYPKVVNKNLTTWSVGAFQGHKTVALSKVVAARFSGSFMSQSKELLAKESVLKISFVETSRPSIAYPDIRPQSVCGVHDVPGCSPVNSASRSHAAPGHLLARDEPATGRLRLARRATNSWLSGPGSSGPR